MITNCVFFMKSSWDAMVYVSFAESNIFDRAVHRKQPSHKHERNIQPKGKLSFYWNDWSCLVVCFYISRDLWSYHWLVGYILWRHIEAKYPRPISLWIFIKCIKTLSSKFNWRRYLYQNFLKRSWMLLNLFEIL